MAADATLAAAVPLLGGQWVVNLNSIDELFVTQHRLIYVSPEASMQTNNRIQLPPHTSKADKLYWARNNSL